MCYNYSKLVAFYFYISDIPYQELLQIPRINGVGKGLLRSSSPTFG